MTRIKEQVLGGGLADSGFRPAVHPTPGAAAAVSGALELGGSAAAAALFDGMVERTQRWVTGHQPGISRDRRACAAVLVAISVGRLVLHGQVSRVLGVDVLSPVGHVRVGRAVVDIHSHARLGPEVAAQAHAAYDRLAVALGAAGSDETGGR